MLKVYVNNEFHNGAIGRREVRRLAPKVARFVVGREREGMKGEVSFSFIEEKRMRGLNRQYRNIDRTTDVLSFPMDEAGEFYRVLGDVVISIPMAIRYAEQAGRPAVEEVVVLMVHGLLHLLGYRDEEPAARRRMLRRQNRLVKEFLASDG